jgi:hypothetical protein
VTSTLLVLIPAVALGAIVAWLCRPTSERRALRFARSYCVDTTAPNLRLFREYLTYQRRLRALLGGGAFVLPGLLAWAVRGSEYATEAGSSWTWLLWGVMVGTVWGELSFARPHPAPGAPRTALLARRSLADYLDPWWRWAPVVAGAAAAAGWLSAWSIPAGDGNLPPPSDLDVAAGVVLGVLVPPVVLATAAYLVGRPQPVVRADMIAADDAVRASSVRTLATVGTTMLLLDLAGALIHWAGPLDGAGDILLATAMCVIAALAVASWTAHGTRPRRPLRRAQALGVEARESTGA